MTALPPNARVPIVIKLLIGLAVLGVLLTLLFPAGGSLAVAKKVQAKNDVVSISTALESFLHEYGNFPVRQPGNVNSAELLNILSAAKGTETSNPKGIVFLEIPPARSHHNGAEINGEGAFASGYKDCWGNEYEIRVDPDAGAPGHVPEVPGPAGVVKKPVIGWSQGDPGKSSKDPARWIKSWE